MTKVPTAISLAVTSWASDRSSASSWAAAAAHRQTQHVIDVFTRSWRFRLGKERGQGEGGREGALPTSKHNSDLEDTPHKKHISHLTCGACLSICAQSQQQLQASLAQQSRGAGVEDDRRDGGGGG